MCGPGITITLARSRPYTPQALSMSRDELQELAAAKPREFRQMRFALLKPFMPRDRLWRLAQTLHRRSMARDSDEYGAVMLQAAWQRYEQANYRSRWSDLELAGYTEEERREAQLMEQLMLDTALPPLDAERDSQSAPASDDASSSEPAPFGQSPHGMRKRTNSARRQAFLASFKTQNKIRLTDSVGLPVRSRGGRNLSRERTTSMVTSPWAKAASVGLEPPWGGKGGKAASHASLPTPPDTSQPLEASMMEASQHAALQAAAQAMMAELLAQQEQTLKTAVTAAIEAAFERQALGPGQSTPQSTAPSIGSCDEPQRGAIQNGPDELMGRASFAGETEARQSNAEDQERATSLATRRIDPLTANNQNV